MSLSHALRRELSLLGHELRILRRSRAFLPTGVLVCAALLFAAWNGAHWISFLDEARDALATEQTTRWQTHVIDAVRSEAGTLDPTFGNPLDPYTLYAWTPLSTVLESRALAFLSVGQSDLHLSYRRSSPADSEGLRHLGEIQNPSTVVLGRLDPARCIVLVLPLLMMLLVVPSSEETDGALGRLIDVQSASVRIAFTRRILIRWATVSALVTTLLVLATVVIAPRAFAEEPLQLAGVLAVTIAYLSTWAALGLACRLLGWSGVNSALVFALVWCAACLLAPALVDRLATASTGPREDLLSPLLHREEELEIAGRESLAGDLAAELGVEPPLPRMADMTSRVESLRRLRQSREQTRSDALAARDRVAWTLSHLAPPLLTLRLLNETAGSDTSSFLAYHDIHRQLGEARVASTLPAFFHDHGSTAAELASWRPVVPLRATPEGHPRLASLPWRVAVLLVPAFLVTAFARRTPHRRS